MPSFYSTTVPPMVRAMKNSIAILKYAQEFAAKNNVDLQTYINASLYPDMKPLPYQVYRFTDSARFIAVRVAGVEKLSQEDNQETFPDLIARIEETIAYLEKLTEKDFEGKEDVEIVMHPSAGPQPGTKVEIRFNAVDYLNYFAFPNFWFHITTLYDILRKEGVDLGKMKFLNGAGLVPSKIVEA